jgi:hypothetical protein
MTEKRRFRSFADTGADGEIAPIQTFARSLRNGEVRTLNRPSWPRQRIVRSAVKRTSAPDF